MGLGKERQVRVPSCCLPGDPWGQPFILPAAKCDGAHQVSPNCAARQEPWCPGCLLEVSHMHSGLYMWLTFVSLALPELELIPHGQ